MDSFLAMLALVGAVIVISALLSGWVDRTGVPQVAVFLAMGALDWTLRPRPARRHGRLAHPAGGRHALAGAGALHRRGVARHEGSAPAPPAGQPRAGAGTILTTILIAAAAWYLLGLSLPLAAILGAAIASTDPVLLRGLLRRPALHNSVRQALRLESGLNDVVLLPVVLVAMEILSRSDPLTGGEWGRLALDMLLLSPGAGIVVGVVGVSAIEVVRKRSGVRRDYESIYSIGLAFAAYAAAESVHGSGFIAAFAAGLTVSAMDAELCDCFLEYGETTAEMALLFAFVLFGTSIIWSGISTASARDRPVYRRGDPAAAGGLLPGVAPGDALEQEPRADCLLRPEGPELAAADHAGRVPRHRRQRVPAAGLQPGRARLGGGPRLLADLRWCAEPRRRPKPAPTGKPILAVREVPDDRPRPNTITLDEYLQLKASGAVRARRQPIGADVRRDRPRAGLDPRASRSFGGRCRAPRTAANGDAGGVLCLTERSHERPCGARVETRRLARRARADRRLQRAQVGRHDVTEHLRHPSTLGTL